MKIFTVETYDNLQFEITESQKLAFAKMIKEEKVKFIEINGSVIAIGNIKSVLFNGDITAQREKEALQGIQNIFGAGTFLLNGEVVKDKVETMEQFWQRHKKMKKIWYDHVKRRPAINERMRPIRIRAHENWVRMAQLLPGDTKIHMGKIDLDYSPEEQAIFKSKDFELWYEQFLPPKSTTKKAEKSLA